jgi:hypothetical protein
MAPFARVSERRKGLLFHASQFCPFSPFEKEKKKKSPVLGETGPRSPPRSLRKATERPEARSKKRKKVRGKTQGGGDLVNRKEGKRKGKLGLSESSIFAHGPGFGLSAFSLISRISEKSLSRGLRDPVLSAARVALGEAAGCFPAGW